MFLTSMTVHSNTTLAAVETAPIIELATTSLEVAQPISGPVSVEQYVKTYFAKTPILARIAKCESRYRQYGSDGEVLRGVAVKDDLGVMQINERYHGAKALELGMDLYTIDGNLAYAKYLYSKEGTTPWNASARCWDY